MKTKLTYALILILIVSFILPNGHIPTAAQSSPPETATETPPPPGSEGDEHDPARDRLYDVQPEPGDWSNLGLDQAAPSSPEAPSGPFSAVQVVAGLSQTCALGSDGSVKCWGDNTRGRLGDGTIINRFNPVPVIGLSGGITQISSFHKHACALTSSGGVKCWGYNAHGELGNNTTIDSLAPVDVIGLTSGVKQIAAGGFHTCALLTDGTVKCWGANWHGQVGDGSTIERHTPQTVIGLNGKVKSIQAGKYHTCAVLYTGELQCWGYNLFGGLGDGTNVQKPHPITVPGLESHVASVSLGAIHTCALMDWGGVKCWGGNDEGALGIGTRHDEWSPKDISSLTSGVVELSAGAYYTCAKMASGGLKCWGDNWAGQLGDGTNTRRTTPVDVVGLNGAIVNFETGDSHTCAVLSDGGIRCWGSNSAGQIGDGTSALRPTPVAPQGLESGTIAIVSGGMHTCALTAAGGVKCWGSNKYGQLGIGNYDDKVAPTDVNGLTSGVVAIGAGTYHTCAILNTGELRCWGWNKYGQLGDNSDTTRNAPVRVKGLTETPLKISAGYGHTCALMTSGAVRCWGDNRKGELGSEGVRESWYPLAATGILGMGGAKAIASGEEHTCALLNGGGVVCWGDNYDGQIGDGTYTNRFVPTAPLNISRATSIAAGIYHSCATIEGGGVKCWGGNYSGQLGYGTLISYPAPWDVQNLPRPAALVRAGAFHTCAIDTSGGAMCWGEDWSQQLGDASTGLSTDPVAVLNLSNVVDLAPGTSDTCAVMASGAARCWGSHAHGEVGDGTLPWNTLPTQVSGLNPVSLSINYGSGKPGSLFLVTGLGFTPKSKATVIVNGQTLTQTVTTDNLGSLAFQLSSQGADLGQYYVVVRTAKSTAVALVLDNSAPLRTGTGPGPLLYLPAHVAYARVTYLPMALTPYRAVTRMITMEKAVK